MAAPTGYNDVAYTHLSVNNVNSAPQITLTTPNVSVVIPHDGTSTFDVTATDADSDPITYVWDLDGNPVGNGNTYIYNAILADAGEHMVTVTISDGSNLSPDTRHTWRMTVSAPDNDNDGYPSNVDCNDSNPDINPGQTEVYHNGLDDDCDPATPDDPDADNDGYDYTIDCDESNAAINPGATEICNLVDDNCDGSIDEGFDVDNDGVTSCGGDCNDNDANIYPAATEICNLVDDNCNGTVDENFDIDGDGVTSCGGDCDDGDNNNYPGNTEVCDLQDNNCDSTIDEGFDADSDGFSQCALPIPDCDDNNANSYPGAPEICDSQDNNCNGSVDEGVNADNDGDGQTACGGDCDDSDPLNFSGNPEVCDNQDNNCDYAVDEGFDVDGDGISICALPTADCDDADNNNYPGNTEVCDLQDNNCDGVVDENFDLDGDSYSVCAVPLPDCDDSEPNNYPGNTEICDLIDNNCDGTIDESFDADGDGFSLCSTPTPDCDDSNPGVYPGRVEVFHNGIDDDCDAATSDDYANTFIIVTDDNGRIYYAQSNGDGSWSNYRQIAQLSGYIRGVAIADYDNDGDLDFTVGSPSGHTMSFYLFINDGTDNFSNAGIVGTGSNANSYQMDMTAGDFNHDGNMDFLGNSNWKYLHKAMGDGHGNFTITTIDLTIGNGRGMDTADFDHDGHLDYVRATYSSGQIILFRGDGSGGFINSGVVGDPGIDPYGVTAGDFNNDGHPDVIANYGSNGDAYFYAGNGDGTFVAGVYVGSIDFNNQGAYDNYDFNRDGNQDLVASTYSSRKIYYYPGNGDGTFGTAVLINPSNTPGNILGISAPPGAPPVGDPIPWITPVPYTGNKGDTVNLSGEFSTDDGNIMDYSWNFGDGNTATGMNVSHAFPNLEDNYTVTLQVTDNDGRIAISSGRVTLLGDTPVADAGGPYTFGEDFAVAGIYSVPLDGSASSDDGANPLQFDWDLGNGLNETFDSPDLHPGLWASSGATISSGEAVVTGAYGWNNRYLVTNQQYQRVAGASFTGRVGTASATDMMWGLKNTGNNYHYNQYPYAIHFANNGWIYIYEDGYSRGNKVTYTRGQSYDLRIDLKDGLGATYYYRLTGAPDWTLLYDSSHSTLSTFRLGAVVYQTAIHLDNFTAPSQTSSEELPNATYPEGAYNISLAVTDVVGQSDNDSTTVSLTHGAPPVAHPGGPYTPGEAQASCGNYTVAFNGSSSSDDSGRIYRYDWDFGDGTTGNGETPSHTYAAGGPVPSNYTATLVVTDHALQQNMITTTASVTPTPGAPPVADAGGDYNVDESAANAGLWTVNFNGNSSSDDTGLCDFAWTFGDGGTATGATPSHQYSAAGDYSASLTARDHALQSHQINFTVHVTVNDPPVADDGGPYTVDEGAAQGGQWTVGFDAGSSTDDNGIWKYEWDFGDGSNGTGAAPTHIYTVPGTYDVTLTITDNGRQTNSTTTQVTVGLNNPPVADAGPNHITEVGLPVTLDASGSTDDFGIYSFNWNFDVTEKWAHSGASMISNTALVTGAGNWGNRYLVSLDTFPRVAGESYTGRVGTAAGSIHMMWGLKNDSSNYHYNQFPHAIYFHDNSWIYIYENGSSRGNKVTYTKGEAYDVRIDVKAVGATYYYRLAGTGSWILIYDSSYASNSPLRIGATVHTGGFEFSDFVTPTGVIPLIFESGATRAVVDTTYLAPGVYNPTVTVTDNALQTDTDSTTITVLLGDPPVANTGGPYSTNEDIPTRFNGRGSSDDFGIKTYTWDFGDGSATLTSRNPWADHRYTVAGGYTATLTVTDFAGQTNTKSTSVAVSPDPVVTAVPWRFSGGIEVPHDSWSGKEATLKAVAWSLHEPLTYTLDFGDGSAPVSGTVSNKRFIQTKHTYTGVNGQPFIATITITDANSVTVSDNYLLRLRARSLDIETNIAIDNGLWYLHGQQSRSETNGFLYGEWSYSGYTASSTASATQAFEINGHLELGDVRENPYVETVSRGLHSMYTKLSTTGISPQTYGDPDSNGNHIGIGVNSGRSPYEGGMVMDAIASSGSPTTFADTGVSNVRNRTYQEIAQDMIDQYAWGQDDDSRTGAWRYGWNQWPDNSAAQWGAIGVLALKHVFNLDMPQWVKDRNNVWLNYSFSGAGFGYTGPGTGQALTPSGLVQMPMDDLETSDPRWIASENTITNNWNSWYKGNCNYYALFALTKAMRLALPGPVVNLTGTGTYNGLDWFNDPISGIARTLIDDNFATSNGSFAGICGHARGNLANAWGVIMLTPTLFVQPPVADTGDDRVWGVDVPITFDRSGSFHLDPFRSIVKYEWDLDGDGSYDTSGSSPTAAYTYTAANCPGSVLPCNITVRLRVTDNNDPARSDTDTLTLIVAVPPHPPVADADGPYSCTAGIPCTLDGSSSFDIDPTDFITEWQWDLDNDGQFDDATGKQPVVVFPTATTAPLNIGLRVLDNAVMHPQGQKLEDFDFTSATVLANNPPVADANGPYTVNEGASITLDGSASSDPDSNPITYAWDLDNDGQFDDATGPTPTFDAATLDDGTYTIGLKVSDSLLEDTITTTVTVTNVAPAVNAGADTTINEGDTFTRSSSFTDPGSNDSWTATVNYGDGTGDQPLALNPDKSFNLSHTSPDNGVFTVTVTVTDDDGGSGSDSLTLTVGNVTPVVGAGADATIDEGNTFTRSGSFTDPGNDSWIATVDYGDGTGDQPLALNPDKSFNLNHTLPNNGVFTVTITVTDDDGGSGSDSLILTVNDLKPTAALSGDTPLNEGQAGNYDASGSSSSPDAIIGYEWDWSYDGSLFQPSGDIGATQPHTWMDNGIYTVAVRVTDDDGSTDIATLVVNVNGVGPVAQLSGNITLDEGQTGNYDASGSFSNPGSIVGYEWDWNYNGSSFSPSGDSGAIRSHTWLDNGIYTVAVRVTDDDGSTDIATLAVTVNDLGPTAVLSGSTSLDAGQAGSYDASSSSSSPDAIISYEWDWNYNGSSFNPSGDSGTTQTHAWASGGNYTVAVRVTDDDGSTSIATLPVTVQDLSIPPTPPIDDLYARAKDSKLDLVWTPKSGATGYNVYRSTTLGGPYTPIATNHQCDYCAYADFGLTNGTTYYYVVTWISGGLESAYSNEAFATPQARRRRR